MTSRAVYKSFDSKRAHTSQIAAIRGHSKFGSVDTGEHNDDSEAVQPTYLLEITLGSLLKYVGREGEAYAGTGARLALRAVASWANTCSRKVKERIDVRP